jgi:hypothetical protein
MLFTAVDNALQESPQWPVPTHLALSHSAYQDARFSWQSVSKKGHMFQTMPYRTQYLCSMFHLKLKCYCTNSDDMYCRIYVTIFQRNPLFFVKVEGRSTILRSVGGYPIITRHGVTYDKTVILILIALVVKLKHS